MNGSNRSRLRSSTRRPSQVTDKVPTPTLPTAITESLIEHARKLQYDAYIGSSVGLVFRGRWGQQYSFAASS